MIFVDTGPFLARYLATDQSHKEALTGWNKIGQTHEPCATTNFVLNEFFTLLARRAGYAFAAQRARTVLDSDIIKVMRPGAEEERTAVSIMEKLADQRVSFTDCISFALMRRSGIKKAFSFDRHFISAGFALWPD